MQKEVKPRMTIKKRKAKILFGPYNLKSQSIWFLYFGSSQFGPCYFQLAINLVPIVNSLTENAYVAKQFALLAHNGDNNNIKSYN